MCPAGTRPPGAEAPGNASPPANSSVANLPVGLLSYLAYAASGVPFIGRNRNGQLDPYDIALTLAIADSEERENGRDEDDREFILISNRNLGFFPARNAPCFVEALDHICPLCSAGFALPDTILSRKSFPTFLSDISITPQTPTYRGGKWGRSGRLSSGRRCPAPHSRS